MTTTLLITALGGEGGGVLTSWIVAAARAHGLAVQATSVPGVAQRTGATTYYLEFAEKDARGRAPVFALFPVAGQVDIVLASELLEASRVVTGGFVTPDRTVLLASSHRVFSMSEKTAMGDSRLDPRVLGDALRSRARRPVLFDMAAISARFGVPISPVMLGTLAGAEVLPIPRAAFEEAIKSGGKAVEDNLAAFGAAFDALSAKQPRDRRKSSPEPVPESGPHDAFPAAVRDVIAIGRERLADYQDSRYAGLYLSRLLPFAAGDVDLCREVARQLAVRMAYEDVIRVAQLKARPDRFERIRGELGLTQDDPFHVVDFLKPGINEICDILPGFLARPVLAWGARNQRVGNFHIAMRLRTTTIWGYLNVRVLAGMRRFRRWTHRYRVEQTAIERWLDLVARAAGKNIAFAMETALLSGLIKGYSETSSRGRESCERILGELVEPILDGRTKNRDPAAAVAEARAGALAE